MENRKLRRRTVRNFAFVALLFAVSAGTWIYSRSQPHLDGLPRPFRQVLEWNGRLWRSRFNPKQESPGRAPQPGKTPRFNGDLGLRSSFDPEQWKLQLFIQEDAPPLELSLAELKALPRTETATEFKCIEGWSEEMSYAGVRFSDFMRYYRIPPRAYVGLETPDGGYYVSLDLESMLHPQTALAYEMNGRPLNLAHGAPLRLVVPVKYGIKSLKRIGKIFFSDQRPRDYWEERGYDWYAGL